MQLQDFRSSPDLVYSLDLLDFVRSEDRSMDRYDIRLNTLADKWLTWGEEEVLEHAKEQKKRAAEDIVEITGAPWKSFLLKRIEDVEDVMKDNSYDGDLSGDNRKQEQRKAKLIKARQAAAIGEMVNALQKCMARLALEVTLVRPRGVQKSLISNTAADLVGIYSRAEPSA